LRVKSGSDLEKYLKMVGGLIIDKNEALGIYKVSVPADSDIPAIVSMINALSGDVQAEPDFAYPVPPLTVRICLCRPVRWPKRFG